jgi:hypothetical protein
LRGTWSSSAQRGTDEDAIDVITIGRDTLPTCVTFMPDEQHFTPRLIAGVGACKISACVHNRIRSCHAQGIDVAVKESAPTCITFRPRARPGK